MLFHVFVLFCCFTVLYFNLRSYAPQLSCAHIRFDFSYFPISDLVSTTHYFWYGSPRSATNGQLLPAWWSHSYIDLIILISIQISNCNVCWVLLLSYSYFWYGWCPSLLKTRFLAGSDTNEQLFLSKGRGSRGVVSMVQPSCSFLICISIQILISDVCRV